MTNPEEILVRGPNWAGDLVMATPAFRALRRAWPTARMTLAAKPGLLLLMAGAPWFDELLPVESHRRGPWKLLREGLHLRRRGGWDLGVCLPDSFEAALYMRLAGVRRLVGYRTDLRSALLHVAVELPRAWGRRAWIPRERHVLGLAEAAGAPARGTELELFVTEAERSRVESLLSARGVEPGAPTAVIAPGASYGPSKLWPAESFALVGDALARRGARVVLVGTPDERGLVARVRETMQEPCADLAGELDLGGLKAAIRGARVLVCNDAGARHVAVAFGVPCIALMGPTSLAKTNLNLEKVRVLASDVGCRPCYLRRCPIDHRCMTAIAPERVIEAALPTLDAAARRRWLGDGALRPVPAPGGSDG